MFSSDSKEGVFHLPSMIKWPLDLFIHFCISFFPCISNITDLLLYYFTLVYFLYSFLFLFYFSFLAFHIFYCCSSTVVSIFPPPQPSPYPTLDTLLLFFEIHVNLLISFYFIDFKYFDSLMCLVPNLYSFRATTTEITDSLSRAVKQTALCAQHPLQLLMSPLQWLWGRAISFLLLRNKLPYDNTTVFRTTHLYVHTFAIGQEFGHIGIQFSVQALTELKWKCQKELWFLSGAQGSLTTWLVACD